MLLSLRAHPRAGLRDRVDRRRTGADVQGAERNQIQALKLAAYAFTASWLAGVAQIRAVDRTLLVALAGGIYSIYLFYLGLPTLMKCPQDQAIGYTVVCIIVAIVIGAVIGFAVASITGGAIPAEPAAPRSSSTRTVRSASSTRGRSGWRRHPNRSRRRKNPATPEAQSAAVGKMLGTALGGGQVKALSPEQLKPFVPARSHRFRARRYPSNATAQWACRSPKPTRASATDDRTLQLEITDTGSAKGLIALAGLASVEDEQATDNGFSKTYHDDGRIVHEQWNDAGSGEYAVVVADRFTVKVSGDAKRIDDLKDAVDEIDLAGLRGAQGRRRHED